MPIAVMTTCRGSPSPNTPSACPAFTHAAPASSTIRIRSARVLRITGPQSMVSRSSSRAA